MTAWARRQSQFGARCLISLRQMSEQVASNCTTFTHADRPAGKASSYGKIEKSTAKAVGEERDLSEVRNLAN